MSDSTITGAICSLLPDGEGSGGVLTPAVAERLMELYPYFALPASIVLRESGGMMSHEERRRLTRHLARTAPSPVVLATLLNDSDEPFYPDEKVATRRPRVQSTHSCRPTAAAVKMTKCSTA